MRHWSALATRNWQVKRVRTAGALLAIALGVGAVVWVSCCYESVRRSMLGWAESYVGRSHVNIESPLGKYNQFALRRVRGITELKDKDGQPLIAHYAPLLVQRLRGMAIRRGDLEEGRQYSPWDAPEQPEVDYHGIDITREFQVRDRPVIAGRMLTADDKYACVLEDDFADEKGVGLGDYLVAWDESGNSQYILEIIGLTQRKRIARFQPPLAIVPLPVLQEINNKYGFVTSVDVMLHDSSDSAVQFAAARIRWVIIKNNAGAHVRSALARMRQVNYAYQQQEVVLGLLSCVAMLTALFIILSTLSMGMLERIAQLGLLRCVGATRWQLAVLVFWEVVPLGVLGIILGIPLGLVLTGLTVWMVPEYVGSFTVSMRGIVLAATAGMATTLVAASLPALAATSVSPLEATHPRAHRSRRAPLIVAALLGLVLLASQLAIVAFKVQRNFEFVHWSATAVVLLYLVYALAAPLIIWIFGSSAVVLVARLIGVQRRLLQDQVGHAVWRSTGICCGLMVGLSLIVALVVLNNSFKAGWQFPKQFPEAYVWSFEQMGVTAEEGAQRMAQIEGVGDFTLANALNIIVEEGPKSPMAQAMLSICWFLGTEPDSFLDIVKLEFIEGDEATARELLRQGGHVLIAVDFARTRKKALVADPERGISNKVRVYFGLGGWRTFRVAGVIDSPALDIAAGYFQAESEARVAAVGSVIGTNADLKRYFSIDSVKMALLNYDLAPLPVPPHWPPPLGSPEARGLRMSAYDEAVPLENRWQGYREELVLRRVCTELKGPQANHGTARELKDKIDSELTKVTYLLTAVPTVALLVAAIGVANLMTANVTSRRKQLAILRAVGATRGQVLRMVVGEALVLGALGSALGLALGVHLAWDVSTMTVRFWGYESPMQIPWPFVSLSVGLTVGLCVLAGIFPARHASRTNVIDALHVA
ncbi:MAG: FtsX-like permease family protein [Planctomycetota bacterium]